MIFKNKKSQKFISTILIILILLPAVLFSPPKKAEATFMDWIGGPSGIISTIWQGIQWVYEKSGISAAITTAGTAVKTWYQELYKQILMAIARRALQEITKGVVAWINTGFHGAPLFLENPESFFKDIAKSEVKNLVDMFGYDSLKYPFGKDFAINTINTYKQTLENNASYSLSRVMTDPVQLRNYQNNFNYGGWNAFLVNTQYPQNNYIGFQMLATEELARRVQGTAQNAVEKVKDVVAQGQGFLSPKTCPSNPYYNNGINEFQRPSFKPSVEYKPVEQADMTNADYETYLKDYKADWENQIAIEKTNWEEENTCPGGLVTTTPGSVVSSQITKALNIPMDSTLQAMGLGNSLSAIFDALLNKFIGDGLNSLTSDKNPKPADDTWSYDGLTLGSPTEGGTNSSWDSGPDEEIILDKFKKQLHGKTIVTTIDPITGAENTIEEIGNTGNGTYISGDIANTEIEIILMNEMPKLMNNTNPNNPGIAQLVQKLDLCVPGPDKGWENRLKEEQERVSKVISTEQSSEDPSKVKASNDLLKELKYTVDLFGDWITMKMITELPGSILYLDAIKELDNFPQQVTETTDAKRTKTQTLIRLQAIAGDEKASVKTGLAAIQTQPEPGSAEEKVLILLKKQYNSLKSSISSSATVENTKSQLDTLKDTSNNLQTLSAKCTAERSAKGWGAIDPTGKGTSVLPSAVGKIFERIIITSRLETGLFGEPKPNAKIIDTRKEDNIITTGTEIEQFCELPIIGGYSHGEIVREDSATQGYEYTFNNLKYPNGNPGYENLPMVNAKNVYGDITCTGLCSWPLGGAGPQDDKRISIKMDCNTIFKARSTDYTKAGESNF